VRISEREGCAQGEEREGEKTHARRGEGKEGAFGGCHWKNKGLGSVGPGAAQEESEDGACFAIRTDA
jgi:hypothetical protein